MFSSRTRGRSSAPGSPVPSPPSPSASVPPEDVVLAQPQEAEGASSRLHTDAVSDLDGGAGRRAGQLDTSSLSVGDVTPRRPKSCARPAIAAYHEFGRPLVICVDNVVDRKHLLSRLAPRRALPAREAGVAALGEVIDIADLRFDQPVADANPMRAPRGTLELLERPEQHSELQRRGQRARGKARYA